MIDLTRQERQVILFITAVFLIGTGIDYASKKYSRVRSMVSFDRNIGKVDINKADIETLMSVSGIGEKLAQRIIEYRSLNERFICLDELKRIKGLNSYRFDKIKDSVYAGEDAKAR